jgi:hypothetical protein
LKSLIEGFYDPCIEYIQEWCVPFLMPLQPMDWINLEEKLTWKGAQVNYVFMKTVVPDLSLSEDDLFYEFSCVQKYCESKLEVWNEGMAKMVLKSGVKCLLILQRRT